MLEWLDCENQQLWLHKLQYDYKLQYHYKPNKADGVQEEMGLEIDKAMEIAIFHRELNLVLYDDSGGVGWEVGGRFQEERNTRPLADLML